MQTSSPIEADGKFEIRFIRAQPSRLTGAHVRVTGHFSDRPRGVPMKKRKNLSVLALILKQLRY